MKKPVMKKRIRRGLLRLVELGEEYMELAPPDDEREEVDLLAALQWVDEHLAWLHNSLRRGRMKSKNPEGGQ